MLQRWLIIQRGAIISHPHVDLLCDRYTRAALKEINIVFDTTLISTSCPGSRFSPYKLSYQLASLYRSH